LHVRLSATADFGEGLSTTTDGGIRLAATADDRGLPATTDTGLPAATDARLATAAYA